MDISKYFKAHEGAVKEALVKEDGNYNWQQLLELHAEKTAQIQRERLIHLMVTLSFGIALFVCVAVASFKPDVWLFAAIFLLLVLLIPYVGHYFFLENTTQRWYALGDKIREKLTGRN
jgi:cell division protein FtsW (lipid II flippase)